MSQLVLSTSPNLLQVRAHLMMTGTDYLTHGQLDLELQILTVMQMKMELATQMSSLLEQTQQTLTLMVTELQTVMKS